MAAHRDRPAEPRPKCSTRWRLPISNGCSATCAPHRRLAEDAGRARPDRRRRSHRTPPPIDADDSPRVRALLRWMAEQHFTFLGYRAYDLEQDADGSDVLHAGRGQRIRDPADAARRPGRPPNGLPSPEHPRHRARHREDAARPHQGQRPLDGAPPTPPRLRRHQALRRRRQRRRRAPLPRALHLGRVQPEPDRHPPAPPQGVATSSTARGLGESSHDGKDLDAILESSPARRDVPDQRSTSSSRRAWGSSRLQERQRVALFIRKDHFGRFVSCLVYVPRDRYSSDVRLRIAELLERAFDAAGTEFHARVAVAARAPALRAAHDPGRRARPPSRRSASSRRSRAAARVRGPTTSASRSMRTLRRGEGPRPHPAMCGRRSRRLPGDVRAADGRRPRRIAAGSRCPDAPARRRGSSAAPTSLDFELYGLGAQPSLCRRRCPASRTSGVAVDDEHPYRSRPAGRVRRWIKHFRMHGLVVDPPDRVRPLRGRVPRDLHRRQRRRRASTGSSLRGRDCGGARSSSCARVLPVPAPDRYAVQPDVHRGDAGRAPRRSPASSSSCSRRGSTPARPRAGRGDADRARRRRSPPRSTRSPSLDEDRILRGVAAPRARDAAHELVPDRRRRPAVPVRRAEARPGAVPDLPLPRPMFEIFVYSPRVEGVHLRCGPGRARRHPLVGPARGLPHRGARA